MELSSIGSGSKSIVLTLNPDFTNDPGTLERYADGQNNYQTVILDNTNSNIKVTFNSKYSKSLWNGYEWMTV